MMEGSRGSHMGELVGCAGPGPTPEALAHGLVVGEGSACETGFSDDADAGGLVPHLTSLWGRQAER